MSSRLPVYRTENLFVGQVLTQEGRRFFLDLSRLLGKIGGLAWSCISKEDSSLNDIGGNLDWERVSKEGSDINELGGSLVHSSLSELDADDHLQYLLLIGRPGQTVVPPLVIGDGSSNTTVEADGTLKFNGNATVWKDIKFPMAPPKVTGAGNPTLTTYNGNMRGYSFAVNDAHDFDPQEIDHDAKIGSTATWHVHFLSRSNDGTDRTVKWEIEYCIEPESGPLPAPTVVSGELTIPAGTAANTPQRLNIATFTVPTIAKLAYARIKRIASSGTEPSVDPKLSALHFHYEIDTVGSREILTK